jgi:enoyl-CoA hydratase/carnithine racemase
MMSDSALSLEISEGIGRVTFSRPDRGDPIDAAFCRDLRVAVHALGASSPTTETRTATTTGSAADRCTPTRQDRPDRPLAVNVISE